MDNQNMRIIVEINGDVKFSRFINTGKKGGVNPLDPDVLKEVKAQLQDALLQVEELLNHK